MERRQGGTAAKIFAALLVVVFVILGFVFLRSCHSGNDPQSLDDDIEVGARHPAALPAPALPFPARV